MADNRIWIEVTVRLDCGCDVTLTLASANEPKHLEKVLMLAHDALPHHFDKTETCHRCELVSEDNPNGCTQKREH